MAGLDADELRAQIGALETAYYSAQKRVVYRYNGVEHDVTYQDGGDLKRAIDDARARLSELEGGNGIFRVTRARFV